MNKNFVLDINKLSKQRWTMDNIPKKFVLDINKLSKQWWTIDNIPKKYVILINSPDNSLYLFIGNRCSYYNDPSRAKDFNSIKTAKAYISRKKIFNAHIIPSSILFNPTPLYVPSEKYYHSSKISCHLTTEIQVIYSYINNPKYSEFNTSEYEIKKVVRQRLLTELDTLKNNLKEYEDIVEKRIKELFPHSVEFINE